MNGFLTIFRAWQNTLHYTVVNTILTKLNLICFRKLLFIAGLLHWIALPCTVVLYILSTFPTVCCRAAPDSKSHNHYIHINVLLRNLNLQKYKKFFKNLQRTGAPTSLWNKQSWQAFPTLHVPYEINLNPKIWSVVRPFEHLHWPLCPHNKHGRRLLIPALILAPARQRDSEALCQIDSSLIFMLILNFTSDSPHIWYKRY